MVDKSATDPGEQERQRIVSAKRGEREAFDALLEQHGRSVLRYLKQMCNHQSDAEDLAQDVFYQAYRRLSTFQEGTNFKGWLLTIAYHAWVHSKRRASATEQTSAALDTVPMRGGANISDAEAGEAIRASLTRLPEDQRTVVLLRFGEGLSHAEISQIVKADPATVRWRLFKARQTLRRVLAAWAPRKVRG